MSPGFRSVCWLLLKIIILVIFLAPFIDSAMAVNEVFEQYNSVQGLSMGNAYTADAAGYSSLYYNPAGLAKASKKDWEIIPIAFDGIGNGQAVTSAIATGSLGLVRLLQNLQSHPGQYMYLRGNAMSAVSMRGFGASFLADTEYAAQSDGTNVDVHAVQDFGPRVGGAINLAGNVLKIGFAAKALLREELNGVYAQSALATPSAMNALMKEGIGLGADMGILLTLPNKFLPTLGVTWQDMFNTNFWGTKILDGQASGAPDPIMQAVNAAVSVHPILSNRWKSTFALELMHIERTDLCIRKRFHVGAQLENNAGFFLWTGLNQMYFTAGMGLRLTGGSIEIGSYAQEIGLPGSFVEDRRYMLRWTINF